MTEARPPSAADPPRVPREEQRARLAALRREEVGDDLERAAEVAHLYMIEPLVELYGGYRVALKVSSSLSGPRPLTASICGQLLAKISRRAPKAAQSAPRHGA